MKRGLAAELSTKDALLAAIRALQRQGLRRLEFYSPVPSDDIDAALGAKRSPLSTAAGVGGLAGAAGGYLLQWLLVAYLYPLDVGGRPAHMPLPFTIITIEMGFLLGALLVVAGFLVGARLFRLWDPIFEVPGFESATRDAYWLAIDASDPAWKAATVTRALREAGARQVHGFGGLG